MKGMICTIVSKRLAQLIERIDGVRRYSTEPIGVYVRGIPFKEVADILCDRYEFTYGVNSALHVYEPYASNTEIVRRLAKLRKALYSAMNEPDLVNAWHMNISETVYLYELYEVVSIWSLHMTSKYGTEMQKASYLM